MPAIFTPTFVVIRDDGREIGRLEGCPGERWFYPEIEVLMDGRETKAGETAEGFRAPWERRLKGRGWSLPTR
ncbi:hypothetical protein [Jiella mangrovi]|uniref:Uncharacterized protein n=1 Tax=Jiella mangrovi TaxID=2821407 RepID=A0ABS4BDH2_9HYPH|nr:hypothetical protein [Jiella mangrovi]MBP0614119.1 hypothetical protein [Jiella mangrovi]